MFLKSIKLWKRRKTLSNIKHNGAISSVAFLSLENVRQIANKIWFRSFLILYLLYKLIFNSFTADLLLPKVVSSFTNAELALDTKTFSLFFGFEANDIQFKTKGDFQGESLFEAKRLALRYNLLSLLFLKLKLSELAIDSATIFLHEKNGIWNYASISKGKSEVPSEPEPESESIDEIKTYLPIAIETHLQLSKIHVRYWKESKDRMLADVYDFNLRLDLETNRFTSIPFNLNFLDEIDSFYFALNPERSLPIELDSDDLTWKQAIPLSMMLDWKNNSNKSAFIFSSNIGREDISLAYKKRNIEFGASLNHHVEYLPDAQVINIKQILLKVMGDPWLAVEGKVYQLNSDDRSIDIEVKESKIDLTPVDRVLAQLEGILPKIKMKGLMSFSGSSVKGNLKNAISKVQLLGNQIVVGFGSSKVHNIQELNLAINSELNLETKLQKTAKDPVPFLQSFQIERCKVNYNGISLLLAGSYQKLDHLTLNATLDNLNLSDFTPIVGGKLNAEIGINASDFSHLPTSLDVNINGFRYAIDRSRSPSSRLNLLGLINLNFDRPFGLNTIQLERLSLLQKTQAGAKALALDLIASISMGKQLKIKTTPAQVSLHLPSLLQTLPLVLKEKVANLQNLIGNDPAFKINSDILIEDNIQKIQAKLSGVIPGLELKDLNLGVDVTISNGNQKKIQIKEVTLNGYEKVLNFKLMGELEENSKLGKAPLGSFFGNLDTQLSIISKEKKYLLKGWSFLGSLDLTAKIRNFDLNGNLTSNKSNFYLNNQKCPGTDCKLFLVDGLNANIPFQHSLDHKTQDSLIVGDKSVFIKTYGRTATPNITINQIVGTHPSIPDLPFEYIKQQGSLPGFSAYIDYRENFASIENLKANSLDGILLGKNMIFNVGSGDPRFMEFRGNIQIRDIDLKQLMSPKVRDKIDDGKIKADLNLSIRDLSEPVANMDLFFSIFQIGSDFGKSALNVISSQNFLMDRIADSYSVKVIDVSLSKGLVYADVYFRRSILSLFVNLEDSKISQQRMPLANFLKRARSEIESYQ